MTMTSSYNFTPKRVRKGRRIYDFVPVVIAKRPKEYTQAMRDRAEAKGHTMPGGGFPIESRADLGRAKRAFGRAKNKPAARSWINRRARAFGAGPLGGSVGKAAFPGAAPPFGSKDKKKDAVKKLLQSFFKADPDTTDGRSGGISHSESDRVGAQDDRTPDEKAEQLLDLYNVAYKNPPMPGEDIETWMGRVWGEKKHWQLFADQHHMMHAIFCRARKLPSHTYAIAKVDILKYAGPDLKDGLVWGWASMIEKDGHTIRDYQGDQITEAELVKAAHDYITNSRTGGAMHIYCEGADRQPLKCGEVVESMVFTKDLQKAMGISLPHIGWLIGYKISNPAVRKAVANGQLKAFSIGGAGLRIPIEE